MSYNPNFRVCSCGAVYYPKDGHVCPDATPAPEPHTDITENKHGGNPFSRAANPDRSAKQRDMRALYEHFVRAGEAGCTCEAAYLAVGLIPQTGSGRCSDLKRAGNGLLRRR
jgi:hypothetical protein